MSEITEPTAAPAPEEGILAATAPDEPADGLASPAPEPTADEPAAADPLPDPLSIACPTCGAEPGQGCEKTLQSGKRKPRAPHAARRKLAEAGAAVNEADAGAAPAGQAPVDETPTDKALADEAPASDLADGPEHTVDTRHGSRRRQHHRDQVTKVYFLKGKVQIDFLHVRDRYSVTTEDPPHPDFLLALGALSGDVHNILEIPKKDGNPVRVYQVTVQHKGQREGYRLFAQRSLLFTPQTHNLETPTKWTGDKDARQALDDDQIARLNKLIGEARLFLDGKRGHEQLGLFTEPDERKEPEAAEPEAAGPEAAEPETDEVPDEAAPAGDGAPTGDGAAPDGTSVAPSQEAADEVTAEFLASQLGPIPRPHSVSATLLHFADQEARVRGWTADGIYPMRAVAGAAELLAKGFTWWYDNYEAETTAGQRRKIMAMQEKLAALAPFVREIAESRAALPPMETEPAEATQEASQEDPPLGTLRAVAQRHGTDVRGARRIMGLKDGATA